MVIFFSLRSMDNEVVKNTLRQSLFIRKIISLRERLEGVFFLSP